MKKPNILYLTYDQQRYDCVSMSGKYPVKTPNLERIAQKGVFFENAYTPIPVCAPARQAIFSGKRPESFGGLWNPHIVFPVKMIPEDIGLYSWTRALHDNGYRTAFIGSWEADDRHEPEFYGFEKYISKSSINSEISSKYPDVKYINGFFGEPNPVPLEDAYTHRSARHVIDTIDEFSASGQPWYIHMDNPEPHLPCRPSAPFDTMYDPDDIPIWGGFYDSFENKPYIQRQQVINWELENRDWDQWKYTVAYYYGIISQYDDAVGEILDKLEENGEIENTIIVYTTDHGDMCGSHRMIDKHYNMYEDICHVPLVIRYDGYIKEGCYTGFTSNCLDVPPTLLELVGITAPEKAFHGVSLAKYLLSGETSDGRDFAVSTYNGQQFGLYCERMITDGKLKYVWNLTDIDELYDLEVDPYELKNIIKVPEYSDKLSQLRKKLYGELERCGDPIIGWTKNQLLLGRKL